MNYEVEMFMNRTVRVFWLALLILFSNKSLCSQDATMPMAVVPGIVPAETAPVPPVPVISPAPVTTPDMTAPGNIPAPTVSIPAVPGIPTQIVDPNAILQTAGGAPAQVATGQLPNIQSSMGQSDMTKPSGAEKTDAEKDIYLNFDNADLINFVNYIAEIRQMNLAVDKTIEGSKISLTIREPLTPEGAWNVFLTVLEMGGFSMIKVGDLWKVIPKDQKTTQPLPAYINVSPDTLPDNDINIRYVMLLTNLEVATMEDLLKNMLSDKGTEIPVKEVNGFVITDKSLNVKSAVKLLLELDQMGSAEAVTVIKLKNANAVDVKTLLEGLIKQPEISPLARLLGKTAEGTTSYFPPGTRVIAEERTNSLVLLGNPKPIKKIEEFITNYLDTGLQQAKSPLHVYELQYTDAQQIADILKEATTMPDSVAGQNATKYGAIRGGVKYFKTMNFKVDKDGNRLVVASTDKVDWKLLKQTIKDLDKPQPQVAIETMIVQISVENDKTLGGGVRNKQHGVLGVNIDAQSSAVSGGPSLETDSSGNPLSLLGNMLQQITATQGLSTLTFGKTSPSNIWGFLQAIRDDTSTTILSQPFLTVANKTAANVVVGDEQNVEQATMGSGGLTGYERVSANTDLKITPQINLDGLVRLDIDLEIDEFVPDTGGTEKIKRNLKTNVAVADGQILVLGGFVQNKVTDAINKTPILGDIPLLGWFFKNKSRTVVKTYLFVFLCPTIVKPRQIPGMGLYTKMKLHEATDDIEAGIMTKKSPDPVHNWFFNPDKENYSHKVIDFANARYQPTTVDIKNDPYYRAQTKREEVAEEARGDGEDDVLPGGTQAQIKTQELASAPVRVKDLSKLYMQPTEQVSSQTQAPTAAALPQVQVELQAPAAQPTAPQPQDLAAAKPAENPPVMPTIEPEKREELKNLIIQEPEPIQAVAQTQLPAQTAPVQAEPAQIAAQASAQVPAQAPDTQIKRDEFKNFISPENKVAQKRSQDINFDIFKRNRLQEFLSKNPSLSKNREPNNEVKKMKEALA